MCFIFIHMCSKKNPQNVQKMKSNISGKTPLVSFKSVKNRKFTNVFLKEVNNGLSNLFLTQPKGP